MTRKATNTGSWNSWLSDFHLGEKRYIETTSEDYARDMRTINTPLSRRPANMKDWKFTTKLFTAIGAGDFKEIRYLICVEREA